MKKECDFPIDEFSIELPFFLEKIRTNSMALKKIHNTKYFRSNCNIALNFLRNE